MVRSIVSALIALSTFASAQAAPSMQTQFAEDNDLWMEDSLMADSNVTKEMFEKIIAAGKAAYEPFAMKNNESLTINNRWDDSTVNANCGRQFGGVTVNMYGGLARRQEVTPDAFALVLCHELGHAYGGTPYIQTFSRMSAEGQADYYGSKECLDLVLKEIPADPAMVTPTDYMKQRCNQHAAEGTEANALCIRKLVAGQGLGNLLSVLKKVTAPNYETPDPLVVRKTELSYPSTVQCRLDTYLAGGIGQARPACWFKN
jgi:hypothetical protein